MIDYEDVIKRAEKDLQDIYQTIKKEEYNTLSTKHKIIIRAIIEAINKN
jgi:uncharacterized protein YfkK (UPF0435 family)